MEDNQLIEALRQIVREEVAPIKNEVAAMRKDLQTVKHDLKEVAWKVDVLYDWVDSIDLKVKKIDNQTA